ncbi:MAG: hypothetical protein KAZ88_05550 [Acidimicrobiia bacterium]|nr:hypothetical protein [Acidimicrobiia bacterium]MBP8180438.1 hypothetical protein [Acidimicrobiia bacterium]
MADETELAETLRGIAVDLEELVHQQLRDQLDGKTGSADERRLQRARRAVLKAADLLDPQSIDW